MILRKFDETDEQYLARLVEGDAQYDSGTIQIQVTELVPVGFRLLTTILVSREGLIDATLADRRQVLRLTPPPGDKENAYRFIERVARRCREVDEFDR